MFRDEAFGNTGIAALARIIEVVSGILRKVPRNSIFAPLVA